MRRAAVPLLSLVVAVLLVAGVVGAASHEPGAVRPEASPPPTTAPPVTAAPITTSSTTPAPVPSIEAVIPDLQAFVERERGLRFKRPVKVSLLDDAAFRARILEATDEDREEVRDAEAVLEAMGLLAPDVDLLSAVERFTGEAVIGLYEPETKELVVRGKAPTPFVRGTLVHELTHALEDQHFDLDRELGDEATAGFQALAEGSALRIEERYLRSLPREEREAAEKEERGQEGVPEDIPEVVQIAFAFPYAFGPDLVRAVLRAGGQARLDAAFANPPQSSEQVLEPERYLRGDAPKAVPAPSSDRPAFDEGEIGQLFLLLMLRAELGEGTAAEAARGWGGDHYVAWKDGRRTCVRMDFVMDTPRDAEQLVQALADWADRRDGDARSSGTSLTTCG